MSVVQDVPIRKEDDSQCVRVEYYARGSCVCGATGDNVKITLEYYEDELPKDYDIKYLCDRHKHW